MPTGQLTILFTDRNDLTGIEEAWLALERRVGTPFVMYSWVWTEIWLRHYTDCVDFCFAIGEYAGEPVGIALITASRPRYLPIPKFRSVVHIGTAGEPRGQSVDVESNRILALPEHHSTFARMLIPAIRHRFRPFAVHLDGFDTSDFAALQSGCLAIEMHDIPCPTFDLRSARDEHRGDILATLGSGVRSRIRRSNRGFGELHGEWATSTDQALAIYEELQHLHQSGWTQRGRPGAFASRRFREFHRDYIAYSMNTTGNVMLFRLSHDDTTIGCLYGFIEAGAVLFYQSGFLQTDDNRLKPGLSTHAACLQQAMERGLDAYNFLGGEARYKRELSTTERLIRSGIVHRYQHTADLIASAERLHLTDRARDVKRWWERRRIAESGETHP